MEAQLDLARKRRFPALPFTSARRSLVYAYTAFNDLEAEVDVSFLAEKTSEAFLTTHRRFEGRSFVGPRINKHNLAYHSRYCNIIY